DNKEYNSSDNEELDMRFEWKDEYFNKERLLVNNMKNLKSTKHSLTYYENS
ncbi:10358_t:CDS:1, partial [Funneliformis caledonium]